MRLRTKLATVASILIAAGTSGAACGGSSANDETDGGPMPGSDASKDGTGEDSPVGCGGCGCVGDTGAPTTVDLSPQQACDLMATDPSGLSGFVFGPSCQAYCPSPKECDLPTNFTAAVVDLNPDAGVPLSDGGSGALVCPTDAGTVTITCLELCTGRLTEGYAAPPRGAAPRSGQQLAAMAYLEAVSVHAFTRLERELKEHGAEAALLRDVRKARRDETRHTAMTKRLARKRGADVKMPEAPRGTTVRSLFEVAMENAVEGCVRETYGAVVGLVEAQTSPDESLRRAMRSIAADECRHAELAWAVHAWAMPQLSAGEKERVEMAMHDAIGEIAASDPHAAALLFA